MHAGGRPRPRPKPAGIPRQLASAASAEPSPLPPAAASGSLQPGQPSAAALPAESAYESLLQGILQSRLADAAAAAAQTLQELHAEAGLASQSSAPTIASADQVWSFLPEQTTCPFQWCQ